MRKIAFLLSVTALTACTDNMSSQQEKAGRTATSFAEAYFNYDFKKAIELTTPETTKWIRFAASNISEEDLNELNNRTEGASVTLTGCELLNDTTCEAVLEIGNYLTADSIGRPIVSRHDGVFRLTVIQRDGQWKIRMAGLPRSETRSHD